MAKTSTRPRRTSAYNLAGAFELVSKSYDIIKRNFEVFMVLFSIGGLLALWDTLARYVDEKEQGRDWENLFANSFFGPDVGNEVFAAGGFALVITVLYILAYLLLVIAALRAAQGQKLAFGNLWGELSAGWLWLKLLASMLLMGIALVIGFILLIIPGVILLWRLFFVPYILVDKKSSIEKAFRGSWRMTRGFAWPIYSIVLVALLFSATGILPILGPLIAFVLSSIYMVAPALRYEELKKLS